MELMTPLNWKAAELSHPNLCATNTPTFPVLCTCKLSCEPAVLAFALITCYISLAAVEISLMSVLPFAFVGDGYHTVAPMDQASLHPGASQCDAAAPPIHWEACFSTLLSQDWPGGLLYPIESGRSEAYSHEPKGGNHLSVHGQING